MGEFSIFHWLVVLAIILIFFGGRRIPEVMKGLGEGIRSFKEGVSGAEKAATQTPSATAAAPSGLTAKSGSGQVALSWSAAAGVTTYNVKRSGASGGPYARIASTSATSYTDEGLAGATTFYYVVSSTVSSTESGNSVEVSATTV
jgi:TatA/E family protein of Tat protein translocase